MEASIFAAIVAGAAAVIAPSLSFYLTKREEREARWRDEKLAYYRELLAALSDIVGSASAPQKERWAHAANTVQLIGSETVLAALHDLLDEIAESNPNRSADEHDRLLSKLVLCIRKDVGLPEAGSESFKARLWASGVR